MAQMDDKYFESLIEWNQTKEKSGFDFDGEIWVYTMLELIPAERLSSNARLALLVLSRHCNPTHQCFVGQQTLAQFMGATDRTVRSAVKELEDKQLIVRTKRPGTSDVYFLKVWAEELDAPPLTENGKMDLTAPDLTPRTTPPLRWEIQFNVHAARSANKRGGILPNELWGLTSL